MGASSESSLWTWLNQAKYILRKDLHMCRVENLVMRGMGDVEGCLKGHQFWIELKCEARPTNLSTNVIPKFRPEQLPWLNRRAQAGGRAFVLLQVGQGRLASRYLIAADDGYEVQAGMTETMLTALAQLDPKAKAVNIIKIAAGF